MNFSSLYLSPKRLAEVIDQRTVSRYTPASSFAGIPGDARQVLASLVAYNNATVSWLEKASLPTLGELVIKGNLEDGQFFTHLGPFCGKGVTTATLRYQSGHPITTTPTLSANLDELAKGTKLTSPIHPENYTSGSAPVYLSGKHRLFFVGRLTKAQLPLLEAQAYAIGYLHCKPRQSMEFSDYEDYLQNRMEVPVWQIDNFAKVAEVDTPSRAELTTLENTRELDVKNAFAEIIEEPYVAVDWGGEMSDLQSNRVLLRGRPVTTVFAFKGRSKAKPMTVADLGKNGDQIFRLFSEPADFIVLQHCHSVTMPVRAHMRAFATRTGQLRPKVAQFVKTPSRLFLS